MPRLELASDEATRSPAGYEPAGLHFAPVRSQVEHTERVSVSVFDLFSIGIGPSSSHTVGPMRAAGRFVAALVESDRLDQTTRVVSELFGSLGATGHGHGSYNAVIWGLEGEDPETVDTRTAPERAAEVRRTGQLALAGRHRIAFDPDADLVLHRRRSLPFHPNGMTFTAYAGDEVGLERTYYSIGGGFVLDDDGTGVSDAAAGPDAGALPVPDRAGAARAVPHDRARSQRGDAGQRVRPATRGPRCGPGC